ncbi:hypothetical protein BJX62DRAFT_228782 [Aspergillus germanicus]
MMPSKVKYTYVENVERLDFMFQEAITLDPPEVVITLWLGIDSDKVTLADAPIRIADLGEAFNPSETKQYTAHAPLLIAPPESRFANERNLNEALSFPSDLWTLACTIWEIFGYGPPFEAFFVSLDKVTVEQFDEDGRKNVKEELRQWHGNTHRDWDTRFSWCIREPREKYNFEFFTTEEEAAFRAMMKLKLVLEPSQRATIDELVECQWIQKWGLPEWRSMQDVVDMSS